MTPAVTDAYAEHRKRQILTAAWESFARHGIRGTTIRGIAESLGLSTGVVYTYFASKEEIVRALVETSLEQNQQLISQLAEQSSFRDAIRGLLGFVQACCSEGAFRVCARANLVTWAAAVEEEVFRDAYRASFIQLRDGITEAAIRGVRDGELDGNLNPAAVAGLTLAIIQGVNVQAALLEASDVQPVLEAAEILFDGARTSGST